MQKQIDEVMDLVEKYGHHVVKLNEAKSNADIANALSVTDENMNLIESKLRELLPVWQPIDESTPTDGREVLAGFQGQFRWVTAIAVATANHGVHASGYGQFTHWMPLPKAPE